MRINKLSPIIFLIVGLMLIGSVSTISIKSYIKNKSVNAPSYNKAFSQSKNNLNKDGDSKGIFLKKPGKLPNRTLLKIYKKKKVLELYGDNKLIGVLGVSLGSSIDGKKEMQGDNKIPEGSYYVCYKTDKTKHTYFIGISYPNINDAKKGLEQGMINEKTFDRIKNSIDNKKQPPWNTALGGDVGIHGGKGTSSLTYGSIVLSNSDINILKNYVKLNTPVYIYP